MRLHLEYAVQIWSSIGNMELGFIEKVQARDTNIPTNVRKAGGIRQD